MEPTAEGASKANTDQARWPLVKVFDLVALVILAAVVIQIVGGVISGAGYPSSDFPGAPLPLYSRLFSATVWANLTTGLLLLGGLAVSTIPRIVWDVPREEIWPGIASKVVIGICGVAVLASFAGMVSVGNTIWNSPQRNPLDSWEIAAVVAAVVLNGLAAVLSWFAIPYVREGPELS